MTFGRALAFGHGRSDEHVATNEERVRRDFWRKAALTRKGVAWSKAQ